MKHMNITTLISKILLYVANVDSSNIVVFTVWNIISANTVIKEVNYLKIRQLLVPLLLMIIIIELETKIIIDIKACT